MNKWICMYFCVYLCI